jgi:hypothetical protein
MHMFKLIVTLMLFCVSRPVFAEKEVLNDWLAIPNGDALTLDERMCFQLSPIKWHTMKVKGELQVMKNITESSLPNEVLNLIQNKKLEGEYEYYPIDKGALLSVDNGEFGSSLWWLTNGNSVKIFNYAVRSITELNGELFGIYGSAHFKFEVGKLVGLSFKEGDWKVKDILSLSDEPLLLRRDGNELLLLTQSRLYKKKVKGNYELLFDNGTWGSFSPNSIILIENSAYIGVSNAVVQLKFKESMSKETWFTKNSDCLK